MTSRNLSSDIVELLKLSQERIEELDVVFDRIEESLREKITLRITKLHEELNVADEDEEESNNTSGGFFQKISSVVMRYYCCRVSSRRNDMISAQRLVYMIADCVIKLRVDIGSSTGDYIQKLDEVVEEIRNDDDEEDDILTKEQYNVIEVFLEARTERLCKYVLNTLIKPYDGLYFLTSRDLYAIVVNLGRQVPSTHSQQHDSESFIVDLTTSRKDR